MMRRSFSKSGFTPLEIRDKHGNLRPDDTSGLSLTGFTLIEIVISMAILAIGLVGILSLFPVGFDSARRSINLTQVSLYAQEKLTEIKKDGFPAVETTSGTFTDTNYTWTAEISEEDPDGYLRKVVLTIMWNYKNKEHSQVFTTYVAKHAP